MLTISAGIILAFFIIGLLEDIPDRTWYWVWGGLIILGIYTFWHTFWSDIYTFILVIAGISIVCLAAERLQHKIDLWFDKHTKKK